MAATLKTISSALNLIDDKKQNLKKAFDDLQSHSTLLPPSLTLSWAEIDSHFTTLHHSLTHRFHQLQSLESQINPNGTALSPSNPPIKDANIPPLQNDPSTSTSVFPQNSVVPGSVTPRYQLSVLCDKMDSVGLRNYLIAHFKERVKIQSELPGALHCAPDPGLIVLEASKGIHDVEIIDSEGLYLRRVRKCCIMLMKALREAKVSVSSEVREKALKFAMEWRGRLMDNSCNLNTLGAMGFLHFVTAFGLVSEFSVDDLNDCVVMTAANVEVPELCRVSGLTERVPDIIQKLIDKGKHVLAVKYVYEFNLADKIPPVPILIACVDESKKLAQRFTLEGKSQSETTARGLRALKTVIKVIENHKLESEFPIAGLEQSIEQLTRQKANKKRPAPASAPKPPQHQQQQQRPKLNIQKQKQKQSGMKRPRTSAAGPTNVNNGSSTIHCQRPLVHPSGLYPEHPNPYMSLPAMPNGMVGPTPTISPYRGPSAGPYGLAGVPTMSPRGNPSLGGSHLNSSSEPNVQSGYYDRASAYGGVGMQHYYQASLYPQ